MIIIMMSTSGYQGLDLLARRSVFFKVSMVQFPYDLFTVLGAISHVKVLVESGVVGAIGHVKVLVESGVVYNQTW